MVAWHQDRRIVGRKTTYTFDYPPPPREVPIIPVSLAPKMELFEN
jgi:hypothetical protein